MIIDAAKAVRLESEIARRGGLGLKRHGTELIGPCPQCGGRDRFSISLPKQVFNCRGCGHGGDIVDLVQHIDGCDFRQAIQTLGAFFHGCGTSISTRKIMDAVPVFHPVNQSTIDGQNTRWALKLWHDAAPIGGTPAEKYLHSRRLHDLLGDSVLRFHASCPFGKGRNPCLLALYRDIVTDEPKAIGRTALSAAGNKIGRMSLGPVGGAAVKLTTDEDVTDGLCIGEGLETTIAAMQLGFKPAWAVGSANAIRTFPALAGIEALTLLVDHDEPDQRGRQAGQDAALECSERWRAAGAEVTRIVPRRLGADMADIIIEQGGSRHATA